MTETEKLKTTLIEGLHEKKGNNIVSLSFEKFENPICKLFIVCDGDSNTHVKALADSAEEYTRKKIGSKVWRKEGFENSEWIILDYADVVVHIFQKSFREYYKIEDLWADAEVNVHEYVAH